jgi:excisionase family DNA binding protein
MADWMELSRHAAPPPEAESCHALEGPAFLPSHRCPRRNSPFGGEWFPVRNRTDDRMLAVACMLTTKEVATRLGCSVQYVRRLLRDGRLLGSKRGRDWIVNDVDFEQFLSMRALTLLSRGLRNRPSKPSSSSVHASPHGDVPGE